MKRLTTEEFIEKAKNVHDNKYNYSLVEYKNNHEKIKIICPKHGIFEQEAGSHLSGCGCPKCYEESRHFQTKTKTTEQFIKEARKIHGDKYDYSLVEYYNALTKIKIICPTHGVFEQTPSKHINTKQGCPYCAGKKTTELFIEKAKKIHGDKYNYSLVDYKKDDTSVKIICPIHGVFEQTPSNHLHKTKPQGCPKCSVSKGEMKIRNFLKEKNIVFEEQKKFSDCKNKRELPFDFYLPENNLLIEYQGEQHYKAVDYFGGEKKLHLQRHRDWLKREFARSNGMTLLTISYKDYNIVEKILEENL